MKKKFLVFDVESIGLFGEGFAVGWTLIQANDGKELSFGMYSCPPDRARGSLQDREWVAANCPKLKETHSHPCYMRRAFNDILDEILGGETWLAADVPWPVEASFLIEVTAHGTLPPIYPLIDVASVRLAVGLDPLATESRLECELPVHDPLADARQSARLLMEAIHGLKGSVQELLIWQHVNARAVDLPREPMKTLGRLLSDDELPIVNAGLDRVQRP